MVTGDSQEEVMIFRDTRTDKHFIIKYISSFLHHHHHHQVHNSTTRVEGFGQPPKTTKGVEGLRKKPQLVRALSRSGIRADSVEEGEAVEYFFASDASAIIEHTNR